MALGCEKEQDFSLGDPFTPLNTPYTLKALCSHYSQCSFHIFCLTPGLGLLQLKSQEFDFSYLLNCPLSEGVKAGSCPAAPNMEKARVTQKTRGADVKLAF